MNRHRILMSAAAAVLFLFAGWQTYLTLTQRRAAAHDAMHAFVHQFHIMQPLEPEAMMKKYEELFGVAAEYHVDYGQLTETYHWLMAGSAAVAALLIVAFLGDTRPRRSKPDSGQQASSPEASR